MKLRNRDVAAPKPAGPAKQAKGVQKKAPTKTTTTTAATAAAATTAAAPGKKEKNAATAKKRAAPKGGRKGKGKANDTGTQDVTSEPEEAGPEGEETHDAADTAEATDANADESRRSTRIQGAKVKGPKGRKPAGPKVASKSKGKGRGKKQAAAAAGGGRRSSPRPLPSLPPSPINTPAAEITVAQRDALRPRSARVAKTWRGHILPAFDQPLWKLRDGRPTLMIPIVVDETDHAEALEEDEHGNQERNPDDNQDADDNRDTAANQDTDAGQDRAEAIPAVQREVERFHAVNERDGEIEGLRDRTTQLQPAVEGPLPHPRVSLTLHPPKPPSAQEQGPGSDPAAKSSDPDDQEDSSTAPDPSDYEPEPYDVPRETKNRGTPRPGDENLVIDDEWPKFIRSPHGYEEGWVGRKPLGRGTQALVGMWEKRDNNGRVVDQICIKEFGDNPHVSYTPHKPLEAVIMEDLCDEPKNGIVRIRGYRRYPRREVHRIYMEYCEHGSLHRLITAHQDKLRHVPEEFIWDVFYHLANACRLMARGPRQRSDEWRDTIVHCDIKPENIFLAAPRGYDEDGIPIYPTARLGDFGLALITGEEDSDNPKKFKGIGTMGYRAPEQKPPKSRLAQLKDQGYSEDFVEDEVTDEEPMLSSKTNIWQVGACIYKLMTLREPSYAFYRRIRKNGEVLPRIATTREPEYTHDLRHLVHQCLKFWPDERPDVDQLLSTVTRNRDAFRDVWAADPDPLNIPHTAILKYTRAAWKEMEFGSWRKPSDSSEPPETPPVSFPSFE